MLYINYFYRIFYFDCSDFWCASTLILYRLHFKHWFAQPYDYFLHPWIAIKLNNMPKKVQSRITNLSWSKNRKSGLSCSSLRHQLSKLSAQTKIQSKTAIYFCTKIWHQHAMRHFNLHIKNNSITETIGQI